MNIIMNTSRIASIDEIESFLQGTESVDFSGSRREEKYLFISDTLVKIKYGTLRKKDRGCVKRYLLKVTGYSEKQIKRLMRLWKDGKLLSSLERSVHSHSFPLKYGPTEVTLLAEADKALNFPNGHALKESLVREYDLFSNEAYKVISQISVSHIYNVKNESPHYQRVAMHYTKTKPVSVPIGERRKPFPDGKVGFLRVDSVHQGDLGKVKGIYHINIIDEVSQWEAIGCCSVISESELIPVLEELISSFPFVIENFHSDNGSEYINGQVADLLNRLVVKQTKSRSRKTNDQALVESKNGSVIRKHMGRNHIPKKYASVVHLFYEKYFNPFLNYHRVCAYATDYTDKRGKVRKKYETYETPYERLKSLPEAETYLKEGVTFAQLDKIAYAESDLSCAKKVKEAREKLFTS